MKRHTDDRQSDLFGNKVTSQESDELPPEIRALLEEEEQQKYRTQDFRSQLAPYFLQALAGIAEDHLVGLSIEFLKKSVPGVLEDQGAQNLWDEICVGLHNESFLSELYEDHLHNILVKMAGGLSRSERVALWLTTYAGECFREALPAKLKVPDDIPVCDDEIAKYVLQSILYEAENDESDWVREMKGY